MEKITFQDINEALEHLQGYAKHYQQKDLQNELQTKIKNRLTEDSKIAIIANKNAGKKTFIKALGGKLSPTCALPDANIALFMFDYEQLDANLSNDEQGLWHTIQERIDKDKNFEVFFVLNKIDMALNSAKSKGDWFYNKQKAIDKLKDAAIEYGIQNPQIYPVSPLYSLLRRKTDKNFDEEDELEMFEKKFKQEFDDKWEAKLIDYIGIANFKKDIDKHIADKSQKYLDESAAIIRKIIEDESEKITKATKILQANDGDNAEEQKLKERRKSLEEALEKIHEEKKEMSKKTEELEKRLDEVATFYLGRIEKIIDEHTQKDMLNPIDEITKKVLAFVEHYTSGNDKTLSRQYAETNAAKITIEKKNIFRPAGMPKLPEEEEDVEDSELEEIINKIETGAYNNLNNIRNEICDFIKEMLNDCKSNYISMYDEIQEFYREIDSKLSSSIEITSNILNKTKHKEESTAKWWKPLTWFDSKNVEVHTIIINGIKPKIDIDSIVSCNIEISGSFTEKPVSFDGLDSDDLDSMKQEMSPQLIRFMCRLISQKNLFDVKNSDGILKYYFTNPYRQVSTGTFWNPLTWGDTDLKKVENEEHIIAINGIKLKSVIEKRVLENIEKLKNAEIQNYKDNIEQIQENIKELPMLSNVANKEQIHKISLELDEINKQLDDIKNQNEINGTKKSELQIQLQEQLKNLNANPLCQTKT